MQLRWDRQEGRRFPALLNTLKPRDTLEVSGEFEMHAFVDNGVLVCNRSITATSVEIYKSNRVVNDGCEIPITTVEEARAENDLEFCIKYLKTKIALDSLTEDMRQMGISKGSIKGLSVTGKSLSRTVETSSRDNKSFPRPSKNQTDEEKLPNRWKVVTGIHRRCKCL